MPIATPEVYNQMLDTAKKGGFAFPAILTKLSESISWMTYPVMLGGGMVIAILMGLVIFFNSTVNLPQRAE